MKTTKDHFKAFENEAWRMIELLGLKDWRVLFAHEFLNENIAEIRYNIGTRNANIILTTEFLDCGDKEFDPAIHARHEVYELLLAEIQRRLMSAKVPDGEIEKLTHTVIRRLEKLCVHGVTE